MLAVAVHDLAAIQQRADHLDIRAELAERHRWQPHRIAAREAGTNAENGTAGGKQVDGGNRMSGDGFDPITGNRNAGGELDAPGMFGRERQAYVDITVDHLRI